LYQARELLLPLPFTEMPKLLFSEVANLATGHPINA